MFTNATPGGVVAVRAVAERAERARLPRIATWSTTLLTLLALGACDQRSTEPRLLDPAAALEGAEVVITAGDDQEAVVGSALPEPLSVIVIDTNGNPIPDAPVTWTFGAGRGNGRGNLDRASQLTLTSDGQGEIVVEWQLGTRAGLQLAWAEIGETSTVTAEESAPATAPKEDDGRKTRGKKVGFQANGRPSNPTQITVSEASLTLNVGETDTLTVVVQDKFGNEVTDATVEWASSDPTVSEVDANGVVTAVHEGDAMVTASQESITAEASVSVTDTTTQPSDPLAEAELQVLSGDGQQAEVGSVLAQPLVVQVVDAGGNPLPEAPVTWTFGSGGGGEQGDPSRTTTVTLTANAQGEVAVEWELGTTAGPQLAWAEVGTTSTITTADIGQHGSVGRKVEVGALGTPGAPAEIVVSQTSLEIDVGQSVVLTAVVLDEYGNEIPDAVVEWSSSDPSVASVESQAAAAPSTSFTALPADMPARTEVEDDAGSGPFVPESAPEGAGDPPGAYDMRDKLAVRPERLLRNRNLPPVEQHALFVATHVREGEDPTRTG